MNPNGAPQILDDFDKMAATVLNWPGLTGIAGCSGILAQLHAFRAKLEAALPYSNLTPAQLERLAYLAEESSEVIKTACKILRHGYDSYHPEVPWITNREDLERELGDARRAYNMLTGARDVSDDVVHQQASKGPPHRYLRHQNPEPKA